MVKSLTTQEMICILDKRIREVDRQRKLSEPMVLEALADGIKELRRLKNIAAIDTDLAKVPPPTEIPSRGD